MQHRLPPYDYTVYRSKCQTFEGTYKADLSNYGELFENKLLWDQASEQRTYSASSIIQFSKNSKRLLRYGAAKGKLLLIQK